QVYIESGSKRVFASALEWPGWSRSAKDEAAALAALAAYAPRYAPVATAAGLPFSHNSGTRFEVLQRVRGSGATDFGVPEHAARRDREPLTRKHADRLAALVWATWTVFDRVVAGAPAELRKGPRGGGRNRDAIFDHVLGAEVGYARMLGLRLKQPDRTDVMAVARHREALVAPIREAVGAPSVEGKGWLPRYAARRIAWHVLDHAWEIEDKSLPATP
ncbi:MAG: hypothetical protein M3069_15500, partial [Chloroflexota bacterium]|nr:hypothetical protein [Chloroflexota bacterium]